MVGELNGVKQSFENFT